MENRWRIVFPTLMLAVLACSHSIYDVSPLSFEIREGYYVDSPPPPQIVLIVSTQTEYRCSNYELAHEFRPAGDLMQVTVFSRVNEPDGCADLVGPAQFRVALPVTIGTYRLELIRNAVTDRYSVAITDTTIDIATVEAHFTHPIALTFPRATSPKP